MSLTVNNNIPISTIKQESEVQGLSSQTSTLYSSSSTSGKDNGTVGKTYEPPSTPEKLKENIEKLLSQNGFDVNNENLVKDVIKKHNVMVSVAQSRGESLDETVVNKRLINYAKGWMYHQFDTNAVNKTDLEFQSDCSKAKSFPELRDKYKQFGNEYVEFMDQDGNGEVDVHEMFYQELVDYYQAQGLKETDAKQKAIETVEKFKNYNALNLPNENDAIYNTPEAEMFTDVLVKLGTLDKDKNLGLSGYEAGAYLMAMAQLDDTKNNITSRENIRAELAIATQNMSLQEIMDTLGFSEEEAANIISYRNKFNNNLEATQKFIETGSFE